MTILADIGALGGTTLGYVVPFLFVLSIVVFFHEFGHFIVGRWCGVRVLTFSIGFGPELVGFNDRRGTRWRLAAIPLGGYVKFFGDANAASLPDAGKAALMTPEEQAVSFFHKPVWRRAAVVVAGPIANFLLAILIFAGIFSIYGKQTVTPRIDSVIADSAAARAGLKAGDTIVSVDGKPVTAFSDLQGAVAPSAGKTLIIGLDRDGARITLPVAPDLRPQPDETGKTVMRATLGVRGTLKPENPVTAVWLGVQETGLIIKQTFSFLSGLVVGREDARELGGAIKIAQISHQVAESSGIVGLISLAAFLSVSIGLLNLFPVPLLDGGHLLFYAIEAVRGRPLGEGTQEVLFRFGFALVMMLMLFTIWNDIVHPFVG